jgi:hypothetical protein
MQANICKAIRRAVFLILWSAFSLSAQTVWLDAVGDVTNRADVVSVTAGYARSNLYLSAKFVDGTLTNIRSFACYFFIDRDRNTNTTLPGGLPYGTDVWFMFNGMKNTNNGTVSDHTFSSVEVPIRFTTNSLHVVIPFSALKITNGTIDLRLATGWTPDPSFMISADLLPDDPQYHGLAQPLMGPTTEIPELNTRVTGGQIFLSWTNATNHVLEAASSPSATTWETLTNVVQEPDGSRSFTEPASGALRFYRLRN